MPVTLLIDDDPDFLEHLEEELVAHGHEVIARQDADDAFQILATRKDINLILIDNRLPGMSGLDFLEELKKQAPAAPPVILITGEHQDEVAMIATNKGAFCYVIKPLDLEETWEKFEPQIKKALEITRPRPDVAFRQSVDPLEEDNSTIIGRSDAMLEVLQDIGRIANMDETVLIYGETGTGKELVAQAIHTHSHRKDKNYVSMNCASFSDTLMEDELFGHEVGAFTGAQELRKGRFEYAHEGTLFLDEVGDMPEGMQVRLLRVLENREITRLGSNTPIKVNVRVIAATHRNLKAGVKEGQFREDLYHRLDGLKIRLPPLRERREDIELLVVRFLSRLLGGKGGMALHPTTLKALQDYHWPGNIRQLQKVLCRSVGTCRGDVLYPEDLDFGEEGADPTTKDHPPQNGEVPLSGPQVLQQLIAWAWKEQESDLWAFLQNHLSQEILRFFKSHPDISQVQLAKILGVSRNTLRKWIEQSERSALRSPDEEPQ